MTFRLRAAVLTAAAFLLLAASASADTATVRIEGEGVSLTKTVSVPTTGTFGPDNCPYDTPGGAIDVATAQNWDRLQYTKTILGETHDFAQRDFWEFWYNGRGSNVGVCDTSQPLNDGDQVLMIVQRSASDYSDTVQPLFITQAPASVERGTPATFTVEQRLYSYPDTTSSPAAGVTVAGGGVSTIADAQGHATLTFPSSGTVTVQATGTSRTRSNVATVNVTEPRGSGTPDAPAPTTTTPAPAGAQRDRTPPRASVTTISTGQVFTRSRAPRLLRGTVDEAGGVRMVKLRLTRTFRGRCSAYSARRERFIRRPKCGAQHGWWFKIADRADWEYQLPSKLPAGRYVLDVNAIDLAYNRDDARRRGENRVVFTVR